MAERNKDNESAFLLQELIHNKEKQAQIFIYGLIASGALLAFAATASVRVSSAVFLLPTVILLPAGLIVLSLRVVSDRMESYIRTTSPGNLYYKGMVGFPWPQGFIYFPMYHLMAWTNLYLSVACIVLTLVLPWLAGQIPDIFAIAGSCASLIGVIVVMKYHRSSDRACIPKEMDDAWLRALERDSPEYSGAQASEECAEPKKPSERRP